MAINKTVRLSKNEAKKQGEYFLKRLINNQKLILILDLDKTVIHAVPVKKDFSAKSLGVENCYDL